MAKWKKVCSVEDVPPGNGRLVMGLYDKPIALFNSEGIFFAINAICPHMAGLLHRGHRVSAYQVKVEDGVVFVGWLLNPG